MDLMQAILDRRSIRKFKPDAISDNDLAKILEAARWAPSWKNSQCWRFVVVRDSEIKNKLADTAIGVLSGSNRGAEAMRDAPVAIVACAELGKSGYSGEGPATDKGDWYMFDVALAMQNLVLAAHAMGLGTVHIGAFDAKKAAEVLGVPEGFCVVEMTPLGYPDEERSSVRKELSEIVYYDRYGAG